MSSRGIAPRRVNTFCPARGPKAMRYAEPGHKQSSGLLVSGEGPGHWPGAACKMTAAACSGRRVRASSLSASGLAR